MSSNPETTGIQVPEDVARVARAITRFADANDIPLSTTEAIGVAWIAVQTLKDTP